MSKKLEFKIAADSYYEDDVEDSNPISKEEERDRKKALQARIRKEQAEGPPPDMAKRSVRRNRHRGGTSSINAGKEIS